MENKEQKDEVKLPMSISFDDQLKLWGLAVFQLNLLVTHLPFEIRIVPHRKGFTDEWLKENGYGSLIDS